MFVNSSPKDNITLDLLRAAGFNPKNIAYMSQQVMGWRISETKNEFENKVLANR